MISNFSSSLFSSSLPHHSAALLTAVAASTAAAHPSHKINDATMTSDPIQFDPLLHDAFPDPINPDPINSLSSAHPLSSLIPTSSPTQSSFLPINPPSPASISLHPSACSTALPPTMTKTQSCLSHTSTLTIPSQNSLSTTSAFPSKCTTSAAATPSLQTLESMSARERRRLRTQIRRGKTKGRLPLRSRSNALSHALRPHSTNTALMDKKAQRVIRNREVALKARQAAKAKMKNLEQENSSLKNRANDLEVENTTLRSQIQMLKKHAEGRGLRNFPWESDMPISSAVGS